jgi:hypothetical protein
MKSGGEKSSFCHDADIEAASPTITHRAPRRQIAAAIF